MNLLRLAGVAEIDDDVRLGGIKVGRGIVEGDVGVLPDADQAQIDGFDRQGLPQPLELARKLGFAVDQRHLFQLHPCQ